MKKFRVDCIFEHIRTKGLFGFSTEITRERESYHIQADSKKEAHEIAGRLIDKEVPLVANHMKEENIKLSLPPSDANVESGDITYTYIITEEK